MPPFFAFSLRNERKTWLSDEKLDETVEALPAFSTHGTDRSGFRAAVRELEAGGLSGLVPTDPDGDGIVVMNLDLHGFESSGGTATSGLREFCKICHRCL